MKQITIYTDGACKGNPGPGGWGAVLQQDSQQHCLKGSEPNTTNNRMELTGAIEALNSLAEPYEVALYTDSEYVRKGITEWIFNWKKRNWRTASKSPVKNADLWKILDEATFRHTIEWHWVKGHSGDPGNELADQLANEAIAEQLQGN